MEKGQCVSRNENQILTGTDHEQIQFPSTAGKIVADPNYRYCIRNTNLEWQYCLRVLQNRWRFAALFGAAIFSVIAVVTYSITPVYEATARLEIEPPGLETFSLATDTSVTRNPFYTNPQADPLKTKTLPPYLILH